MPSKLHSMLRSVLVCALSMLATASLAQTTIHVGPGQAYTTIQSGIDAASAGDTVLVASGTYNENINFDGKAITVTSSGGAAATTINGGNKPGLATVTFANGETRSSVISGFTITGGGDTIFSGNSDGGVYVSGGSPTIQGNTVTANYCHDIDVQFGAAAILNNEVSGVLAGQGSGVDLSYCTFGSGIHLGGTNNYVNGLGSIVIGNTIENNNGQEPAGISGIVGGGIFIWAAQNVLIMNNIIRNNTVGDPGSAFVSANSTGTVIVQNLIYGNTSCAGAIAPENGGNDPTNPSILIANNVLADNFATQANADLSSCIAISQIYPGPFSYGSSSPGFVIVNNIVTGSTSYPAVNCAWFSPPSLSDQPTFENNILYNAGGSFFGSYCVDVSNQDGNIAVDPQLVNPTAGNYQLQSTSPAIDAGLNSVLQTFKAMTGMDWTKDFAGNPRVQNGSGKGCTIDMGAYEYRGSLNDCGVSETLTSSLNPALAGQNVTFTAKLSDASGTPTGTVQFLDGATPLSTQTVSNSGSASFTTNSLTIGSHTITANYQPTGTFGASTASLVQVINGDPTSTALTCTPNSIDISNTAQFTATVTSALGTPTGSVSFTDDGTLLATNPLVGGATSLAYTGSSAGTHTIMASYIPTGSFAASSATCSEAVNSLPTTSVLKVAPPASTFGSSVTLTATVSTVKQPPPSTPTGVVTFYRGASAIGTGTLAAGVAALTTNTLPGGSYNLTCTYGGSSIYSTSSCAPVPVVINPAPSALTLTSGRNPAPYLSSVTFTVGLTLNGRPAGAGNTIHLGINGQTINLTTDAAGSATYSISTLPPNSYPVTASFTATNDFLARTASLMQVITAAPTSISLTAAPNPGDLNQQVTLTATVTSQSTAVGNGDVTFYDGSAALGTSPLSSSGTATRSATFTSLGIHNLTAVFNGTIDFSTSTSAVFKETIVAGDFSISAKPANFRLYTGQSAAVQVDVASLRGFNQPLTLSCAGLPANTTCTFSPATFDQGQGTSKLVIQTSAPHKAAAASGSVLGMLILLLLPRRRRSFLARCCVVLLAALCISMGIAGCGSAAPITGGTPPGTYKVAVTATTQGAAPLTHSATVTLTVKSLF
jgi:hypothetical protein